MQHLAWVVAVLGIVGCGSKQPPNAETNTPAPSPEPVCAFSETDPAATLRWYFQTNKSVEKTNQSGNEYLAKESKAKADQILSTAVGRSVRWPMAISSVKMGDGSNPLGGPRAKTPDFRFLGPLVSVIPFRHKDYKNRICYILYPLKVFPTINADYLEWAKTSTSGTPCILTGKIKSLNATEPSAWWETNEKGVEVVMGTNLSLHVDLDSPVIGPH